MRWLVSIFSFHGRARRRDYGIFLIVSLVVFLAWSPIVFALMIKSSPDAFIQAYDKAKLPVPSFYFWVIGLPMRDFVWANIAAGVVILLLYIIWIALCVRRLHDMGVTGWLFAIIFVVSLFPYLGYLLASLILVLFPGTMGRNRFGLDPRGRDQEIAHVFEGAAQGP